MKKFLNSYKAICIALVIITLSVLIYHIYTVKNTNIYVFGGYNEDITILDGTIFTSFNVNRFAAPNIIVNNNTKVKEYRIGYYIKNKPISVISNAKNQALKDVKLKDIIENAEFSFTEVHKNAEYFSKNNIKNIKKLSFKISAKDIEGNEINIELPLDVTKIR